MFWNVSFKSNFTESYPFSSGKIIKEKCDTCRGQGKVEKLTLVEIDVPAGISENERVRTMSNGAEIYVSFNINRDSTLKRDGMHIHSDVNISVAQAILGGRFVQGHIR